MFDHVAIRVADFDAAKRFYEAALAPLGHRVIAPSGDAGARVVGFGGGDGTDFWIGEGGTVAGPLHIAFRAPDRAAVDAFHAAAVASGGRDNGPPGLRARYHPDYYGAFVLDPDGNNVEAVCHAAAVGDRPAV